MVKQNIEFDIIGDYSKEEYNELDPQETVNMFRVNASNGKKALFPTPGLLEEITFSQSPTGAGRNATIFNEKMFANVGSEIYRCVSSSIGLDYALIGSIATRIGHVGYASLQNKLTFADGVGAWIWDEDASTFSQITFGFEIKPIDITTFKNRVIAVNGETGQTYYSDINDPNSWDIFNLYTFPNGDINVACESLGDRLYIFGKKSTEIYAPRQGATLFPFQPAEPLLEIGCISAASVAKAFGLLVWVSKTQSGVGSVLVTNGGAPTKVSTNSIETEFAKLDNPDDASGFIYKNENGHVMYELGFSADNVSFLYDFDTKSWSKLETARKKAPYSRHLAQKHAFLEGNHYVLDYSAPILYKMSNKYGDDNGTKIRRMRISSILEAPPHSLISINKLTLKLKQGTGLDCGIEENPQVFLQLSLDEGESYGNALRADIGEIGERMWETSYDNLAGAVSSVVFKIEHYNAVPFVIKQEDLKINVVEAR